MSNEIKEGIMKQASEGVDSSLADIALEQSRQESKEQLKNECAVTYMLKVKNLAEAEEQECYSTGFDQLDEALDGGLYPGLYIIGAISSLGKTSFILQMADQIASSGTDVLYFSLEMAATELVSKSISRLTYQLCEGRPYLAKSARGIMSSARRKKYDDREKDLIDNAYGEYVKLAKNLYFFEGMGDIGVNRVKQIIESHKRIMKKKAVVMIDYLQILAPFDIHFSDKQNTDKAVLELKRMSRDLNVPVIAISSFNRDSYTNEVKMASFKESGAIEYGSDVLIALQPQGMLPGYTKTEQKKNVALTELCKTSPVRKIEVKILKNRNGSTGGRVGFDYRAQFNLFDEDKYYKPKSTEAEDFEDIEDDLPEQFTV